MIKLRDEKKVKPDTVVWLEDDRSGLIRLKAMFENNVSSTCTLLSIDTNDGSSYAPKGVLKELGFKLNENDGLKIN